VERIGFVPMVVWKLIEILLKTVSLRTLPGGDAAHGEGGRFRKWRAAVRFRLKKEAGFCEIEKRVARSPLGSPLLLLPKGVPGFF
jgi:hypothetical protein